MCRGSMAGSGWLLAMIATGADIITWPLLDRTDNEIVDGIVERAGDVSTQSRQQGP